MAPSTGNGEAGGIEAISLDHVQMAIPRGGEDAAGRFWVGLLGLAESAKPAALAARGGLWLRLDRGIGLHLAVDSEFQPARKAHVALRLDLDAALAALEAASHDAAVDRDPLGRRRCYVDDSLGNRVELIGDDPPARAPEP